MIIDCSLEKSRSDVLYVLCYHCMINEGGVVLEFIWNGVNLVTLTCKYESVLSKTVCVSE